jgi:hypothetical protein
LESIRTINAEASGSEPLDRIDLNSETNALNQALTWNDALKKAPRQLESLAVSATQITLELNTRS